MDIPSFKYHPEPLKTGSIIASKNQCMCCGKSRGFIYTGPAYCRETINEGLCPWCIADGSAHAKFGATFTDDVGVGGDGRWDEVPEKVIEEVAQRTPGFNSWQEGKWWTHCGDAGAFLGAAGHAELLAMGAGAIKAIREDAGLKEGAEWEEFFEALDKDGAPVAYMFRCRKCGALGGYQDTD